MNAHTGVRSYEEQLKQACHFINQNDHFLVVAHVNPDGDAASSTFAIGWLLNRLGKHFTMVNEDTLPNKFSYLWGYDQLTEFTHLSDQLAIHAVISVDCADESRMGKVRERFPANVPLLNIDHHPTNDYFGHVQLIRVDAAATVELIYDLTGRLGLQMTKELAECIYTGLLTDTGGFRYSNTSPEVMRIASDLLQHGVQGYQLAEILLETITRSHISVLQRALRTLSFAFEYRVSWISVSAEDIELSKATPEDLEGLIQYPRNIEGVEVGLLFKQVEANRVKISFRSSGNVDVAKIAKFYGGGGHVRASGCTVDGALQDVIEQVIAEVGRALE